MSNLSTIENKQVTMSSREIAELTHKKHFHVCRDIRSILVALLGGEDEDYIRNPKLLYLTNQHVKCEQYDTKNPNAWEYHISRRYTEILITGYDIKRRTAVIDKLYELDAAQRTTPKDSLNDFRRARTVSMATKSAETVVKYLPNLSQASIQSLFASIVNNTVQEQIIPLPVLENKTYSATEVGEQLGISANKVGRLANTLFLKNDQYGISVLDKSKTSDKQVETFRYYQKAIDVMSEYLADKKSA